MGSADVSSALRSFLEVQDCRAQLYTLFHNGFKSYLLDKQESSYKSLMAELTVSFNDCSKRVIALEASLKELGRPDLAATLRRVQESERDKLRLTLALQALKQAAAFRTFSWQQRKGTDADGGEGDDDEALALLDPGYAADLRLHGHGHCCHAHSNGHSSSEAHTLAHSHAHAHQPDENGQGIDQAAANGHVPQGAEEREGCAAVEAAAELGPGSADATPAAGADVGRDQGHAAAGSCNLGSGVGGCSGFAQSPAACGGDVAARDGGTGTASAADGECLAGGPSCQIAGGSTDREDAAGQAKGGGCGAAAAPPPEPTRREYEAAVKEAMQGLDLCIRKINEAIDDIRIELDDE